MFDTKQLRQQVSEMKELSIRIDRARAAEQSLEEAFATLFEVVPVCLFVKEADVGGRILRVNDVAVTTFGMAREDIVGKTGLELWGPQHAAKWAEEDAEVARTGRPLHDLLDYVDVGGDVRVFLVSKMPILMNGDPVNQLLVHAQDITDVLPRSCLRAQEDEVCQIVRARRGLPGGFDIDTQEG